MLRPEAFQQPYVTLRNLPYSVTNDGVAADAFGQGGVLGQGQVVWTREAFAQQPCPHATLAYVEELGVVSLDPRWLTRAERVAAERVASERVKDESFLLREL